MRGSWWLVALALAAAPVSAAAQAGGDRRAALIELERGLHKRTGDIALFGANAKLSLGDRFYFLDAAEAKKVLVEVWGNPPSSAEGVLGLVMPAGTTVLDNVWGAVVTYQDTGHVGDHDATTADYGKILDGIRESEAADNEERVKAGYPAMHLVGWAQAPTYDARSHAMVWARDVKVDGATTDSLNYDVRLLGRTGVLSLNMLSDMPHLPEVRAAAASFGQTASFVPGSTYADFDPKNDKDAGYGLAGLVAAGVGVAAAKKFGLLALVLAFGKKALVLVALGWAAITRWGKRLFRRGGNGSADDGGTTA